MNDDTWIWTGPTRPKAVLLLAHGAGAGWDTPFMNSIADGLAEKKIRVGRFEFPYMAEKRTTGKNRPPDREPKLTQCWLDRIAEVKRKNVFIGGKSMGGRIASLVCDQVDVRGLVCLGYPFHPTGKPEKLRTEHLEELKTPALIVQGTRDPFGNADEVAGYSLAKTIELCWLDDGDHSFKPRKSSGRTLEMNMTEAIDRIADFLIRMAQ